MNTSVSLTDKLAFKNPLLSASGTFAYGEEFSEFFDLGILGGIITKGLSLEPKEGNPSPRVAETHCGMINSIGLENIGIPSFLKEKLPFLLNYDTNIIVNFFGTTEEEYMRAAQALDKSGISALEMNVSCPNVSKGGIEFGRDPEGLYALVKKVRSACGKTLIIKLSPMVTDIVAIAQAVKEARADAVTCSNTLPAMLVDEKTKRPVLGNITGGLSGPAIKPITLKIVWDVFRNVKIPIIASGGITSARDVIQFMLVGATAVQIGTAALRDPLCYLTIMDDIKTYMAENCIQELSEIIGTLET